MAKDNTILYLGAAVLAYFFLSDKGSLLADNGAFANSLANDIAAGKVVLDIEKSPMPYLETKEEANKRMICYMFRDINASGILKDANRCNDIYNE